MGLTWLLRHLPVSSVSQLYSFMPVRTFEYYVIVNLVPALKRGCSLWVTSSSEHR